MQRAVSSSAFEAFFNETLQGSAFTDVYETFAWLAIFMLNQNNFHSETNITREEFKPPFTHEFTHPNVIGILTFKAVFMKPNIIFFLQFRSTKVFKCTLNVNTFHTFTRDNIHLKDLDIFSDRIVQHIVEPLIEEHSLCTAQEILHREINRTLDSDSLNVKTHHDVLVALIHCVILSEISPNISMGILSPQAEPIFCKLFSNTWNAKRDTYTFRYEFPRGEYAAEMICLPMGKNLVLILRQVGQNKILEKFTVKGNKYICDEELINIIGSGGLIAALKKGIIQRGFYPFLGKRCTTEGHGFSYLDLSGDTVFKLLQYLNWKDLIQLNKVNHVSYKLSNSIFLWKTHTINKFPSVVNTITETHWKYEFMTRYVRENENLVQPPARFYIRTTRMLFGQIPTI